MQHRLLHLSRFSNGAPSANQRVMIDDVISTGPGPIARELADIEVGDAWWFSLLTSSLRVDSASLCQIRRL